MTLQHMFFQLNFLFHHKTIIQLILQEIWYFETESLTRQEVLHELKQVLDLLVTRVEEFPIPVPWSYLQRKDGYCYTENRWLAFFDQKKDIFCWKA